MRVQGPVSGSRRNEKASWWAMGAVVGGPTSSGSQTHRCSWSGGGEGADQTKDGKPRSTVAIALPGKVNPAKAVFIR